MRVRVCVFVRPCVCVYAALRMRVHMCIFIYTHVYMSMYTGTCMYMYKSGLQFTCVYTHMYKQLAGERRSESRDVRVHIHTCLFISHFPQKSPIISGSFAKNDVQIKAAYVCEHEHPYSRNAAHPLAACTYVYTHM